MLPMATFVHVEDLSYAPENAAVSAFHNCSASLEIWISMCHWSTVFMAIIWRKGKGRLIAVGFSNIPNVRLVLYIYLNPPLLFFERGLTSSVSLPLRSSRSRRFF